MKILFSDEKSFDIDGVYNSQNDRMWAVDRAAYIEQVLSVALKYGNQVFGSDWVFQQDCAQSHSHHLTQQWCRDNVPSCIDMNRWLPNSRDLNPLN